MATNQPYRNVAYGLSEPLLNVFPAPIVSVRDPLTTDKAQLGTVWVNKLTNDASVITSIVANAATWVPIGGGAGTFTSLTVNPGNITATAGNISATAGSLNAGTTITAGTGLTVTTGNLNVSAGSVIVTGSVTASVATSGRTLSATGDSGSGFATFTTLTNVTNTAQSSGNLLVLSTTGNNGSNAGFIKVYVGLTTAYIPYYTNIAP